MRLLSLMVVGAFLRSTECLALESEAPPQPQSSSVSIEQPQSFDLTDPSLVFISGNDRSIHVMNYITQQEVTRIKGGQYFDFMKFTPDGRYLLLVYRPSTSNKMCTARKKIILLNTLNWQQEGKVTLKSDLPLKELTITADSQYTLLIDNRMYNTISVITLETLEMTEIEVGQCPFGLFS